jgi:AAA+ superfamily predicted ATPase
MSENQPPKSAGLPKWAEELREQFVSGSVGQFIVYGNIFDVVPYTTPQGNILFPSLKEFLTDAMLASYDIILVYDRGKGIRAPKGDKEWTEWLNAARVSGDWGESPTLGTRNPVRAMELIDFYILRMLNLQAIKRKQGEAASFKMAVIIDFAQFIVPTGDPIQLTGDISSFIVKILTWANDPAILNNNIVTILTTEKLNDVNALIVGNPRSAKIEIKLPTEDEMLDYVKWLKSTSFPKLEELCDVKLDILAKRLTGLSRVEAKNAVAFPLANGQRITEKMLGNKKKELIEKECQELLEFLESPYTLDLVAGHEPVKQWLREDGQLLKEGRLHALPMGYLIAGRIGTGKTFMVQCWAGELGVPCVVLKNFRDKWVGATESNLEKIFSILHALGQAIVFVDEADQITGKRGGGDSDSGLSGRVYAMLAKEMSDTRNRGKIIWVFATSRPDLVEVDLKRQGRLDVHIPLFPPQTEKEVHDLFLSIAKKLKFPLKPEDLPTMKEGTDFGGHEIEGILVRALRAYELRREGEEKPISEIFKKVIEEMKPSAQTKKLEYMDLVAVRECTDSRFLPERYRNLSPEEVELRIDTLRRFM